MRHHELHWASGASRISVVDGREQGATLFPFHRLAYYDSGGGGSGVIFMRWRRLGFELGGSRTDAFSICEDSIGGSKYIKRADTQHMLVAHILIHIYPTCIRYYITQFPWPF